MIVDAIAVTNVEPALGTEAPDGMLHKTRKTGRSLRTKGAASISLEQRSRTSAQPRGLVAQAAKEDPPRLGNAGAVQYGRRGSLFLTGPPPCRTRMRFTVDLGNSSSLPDVFRPFDFEIAQVDANVKGRGAAINIGVELASAHISDFNLKATIS